MPGGQTLKLTILGVTGSGKSTLGAEIIEERDRVLVLDSMGDYGDIKDAEICEGGDECIARLLELQEKKHWKLICITETIQEGLDILAVGFEMTGITIVIDESSLYCNPSFLPEEMAKLIRYGRKREIDLIFLARRASEIHRELTAQSNLLVTFTQYEPIDIKALRARMGKKAEGAVNLPKYKIIAHGEMELAPLAVLKRLRTQKGVDTKPIPE